jgi:hypothetical protein
MLKRANRKIVFTVSRSRLPSRWIIRSCTSLSTWSWTDAAKFYSDGEWTHQQKVQFDAYRLALGLIHYHNALPQQNRLDCAEWAPREEGHAKVCRKPVIYGHDLGSTFGKKRSGFDLFGTNPRGSFDAWEPQTVFLNPGNCELRATLLGDKQHCRQPVG